MSTAVARSFLRDADDQQARSEVLNSLIESVGPSPLTT